MCFIQLPSLKTSQEPQWEIQTRSASAVWANSSCCCASVRNRLCVSHSASSSPAEPSSVLTAAQHLLAPQPAQTAPHCSTKYRNKHTGMTLKKTALWMPCALPELLQKSLWHDSIMAQLWQKHSAAVMEIRQYILKCRRLTFQWLLRLETLLPERGKGETENFTSNKTFWYRLALICKWTQGGNNNCFLF